MEQSESTAVGMENEEDQGALVGCCRHYVGRRPQVTWRAEMDQQNLSFLRGIDAHYFGHIADTHALLLETKSKHYAAAAIRVAYGQALETLMALIGATLQAPGCPSGWMVSYQNNELRQVVEDLVSPEGLSHTTWDLGREPLHRLAGAVLEPAGWPDDVLDHRAALFGRAWTRWCHEFLDETFKAEYNAMKHGTRAQLGGFSLSIGLETTPGSAADPSSMRTLGASEFGCTFAVPVKLIGRLHQTSRTVSRNWSPLAMVYGLHLMAASITNILSFLRIRLGDDPTTCPIEFFPDDSIFERIWVRPSVHTMSGFEYAVAREHVTAWTSEEVDADLRDRRSRFLASRNRETK